MTVHNLTARPSPRLDHLHPALQTQPDTLARGYRFAGLGEAKGTDAGTLGHWGLHNHGR
jgi:hypothetical protein